MSDTRPPVAGNDKFLFVYASDLDSVRDDPEPGHGDGKSWLDTLNAPAADEVLTALRMIFTTTYRQDFADDADLRMLADVRQFATEAIAFEERERQPGHRILVPDWLVAPHPLVERTHRSLDSARPDDVGLLRRKARCCLDVVVSRDALSRAMRIMDAVMKALESRNLIGEAAESTTSSTSVVVLDERVTFLLEELTQRRERAPNEKEKEEAAFWGSLREKQRFYERYPTGRLSLCISNGPSGMRHRWSDSGGQPLESLLNAFVRGLARNAEGRKFAESEAERRQREFRRLEEQRRAEAERQRIEAERRREEEARFQKLEKMAEYWHRSERIRGFLGAIERAAESRETIISPDSELGHWLAWAESRALSLDPVHGVLNSARVVDSPV